MDGFAAVDYGIAREVLQRGIALLFVVAFASTWRQFPVLLGERGLQRRPKQPARFTIFRWVPYTDRRLRILCAFGILIALLLVAGVPQLGPPWAPMLAFLLLWGGYMSVTSLGAVFYSFGWEMLLLELGFLAAFLGSRDQAPPVVVIVLFWWLLFRLEFGAGMIKIRGGREWRDLTALMYHHETQPMPAPLSRQAHLLPRWFHRLEVVGNHFAQLVVPWFLFVPGVVGSVAAGVVVATQLWLVISGNFAWLNWATIVIAFSAVAVPGVAVGSAELPLYWLVVTCAVGAWYVWLSWPALHNLFFAKRQVMNGAFNRLQLANAYGAFGSVTKVRIEYVVEGTRDANPRDAEWREYEFYGKPGDVTRRPRQFAPYHLRLDWLMWFLPLGRGLDGWFRVFLGRLLEADAATLRLVRVDPFAGKRPTWVRVVAYRYRFATRAQHRETGAVWVRDQRRLLTAPMRLRN